MRTEGRKSRAFELLMKLGEAHGAPGYEDSVRHIFREELGAAVFTDRMGNIFCEKKGNSANPTILLSGHMDEVGFVVQAITKAGLIKFLPLGSWWSQTLLAHRVRIRTQGGREILGVIGAKPPHLLSESERERPVKIEDMLIDVGAIDADDLRKRFGIRLGDSIVPYSPFVPMHNPDFLLSKAFDNRVGMALTIQTLQLLTDISHPNTVWGSGTVQEELGVRGAQTVAFTVNPDAAIILEGAPADDLAGISEDERQGAVGRGVQIRLLDPSAIANQRFAQYSIALAESQGIPHQVAVRKSGSTDAGPIHLHQKGVPTVVLSVPARYIHTHNSMIHLEDYLSTLRLVLGLLESLDQDKVNAFCCFLDQ
jgi:putative aminopeptidase FrvX